MKSLPVEIGELHALEVCCCYYYILFQINKSINLKVLFSVKIVNLVIENYNYKIIKLLFFRFVK